VMSTPTTTRMAKAVISSPRTVVRGLADSRLNVCVRLSPVRVSFDMNGSFALSVPRPVRETPRHGAAPGDRGRPGAHTRPGSTAPEAEAPSGLPLAPLGYQAP